MGFPILATCRLYIESAPWSFDDFFVDRSVHIRRKCYHVIVIHINRPISQIPACICFVSHNAPLRIEICIFRTVFSAFKLNSNILERNYLLFVWKCGGLCQTGIRIMYYVWMLMLTHWGRDKMDAISQTTFSNEFSWMKMYEYRLKFYLSLFLRVQFTISQHWFR